MPFLGPHDVPRSLLKELEPDERQLIAVSLGTLQAYTLVSFNSVSETCNIHRLVRLAMKARLKNIKDTTALDMAATEALYVMEKRFPQDEPGP
jgi:hypothetical protein